jgi:hypothetical protein
MAALQQQQWAEGRSGEAISHAFFLYRSIANVSRVAGGALTPAPTRAEWEVISAWCVRYHAEQLLWARGGVEDDAKSLFDGTIGSVIEIYT